MSRKGPDFEREICPMLSRWWTGSDREDVFWRTPTSGARATARKKKGKSTKNQSGDVMATDPIGQPLLDWMALELKRGYNGISIQDLVDKKPKLYVSGPPKDTVGAFISQAKQHQARTGSRHWGLIWQKDKREKLLICPEGAVLDLLGSARPSPPVAPGAVVVTPGEALVCVLLDNFLTRFSPDDVRRALALKPAAEARA